MKTINVEVSLGIGYQSKHEDILEVLVDDDATPEQIEKEINEQVNDWAWNYIDLGYSIINTPS